MRHISLIVVSLAGLTSLANADATSSRDFPAASFDHIVLDTAATVEVVAGTVYSVHAEGDASRVTTLTATVRDDALVLGSPDVKSDGRKLLMIMVTLPRLAGLDLEGAGHIVADQANGPDFRAILGGAGTIDVAAVKAKHTEVRLEGNGKISLAGTSDTVDVDMSGLGQVDVARLTTTKGTFNVSGRGHIAATVYGSAEAKLSGMGGILIGGQPHCAIVKSGIGSVRCAS